MKILVLSYYFFPFNGVGANRANSLSLYLSNHNNVKVISNNFNYDVPRKQMNSNLSVHYLNCESNTISKFRNLKALVNNVQDYHINLSSVYEEIREISNDFKPDIIIATSNPLNSLKVAFKLYKETGVPYVCDLRDYENQFISNKNKINVSFLHFLVKDYLNIKFFKNSLFNIGVSDFITRHLKKHNKHSFTITNGFDKIEEDIDILDKHKTGKFTVSFIGTLYSNQDAKMFVDSFKDFSTAKHDVVLNFIGSRSEYTINLLEVLENSKYLLTERLEKSEIKNYLINTNIFIQFPFIKQKGIFSTKIFEYLSYRKPILLSPSDNSVMQELLDYTKAGTTLNNTDEIISFLEKNYKEWKENGFIAFQSDENKIAEFSREKLNEDFYNIIKMRMKDSKPINI